MSTKTSPRERRVKIDGILYPYDDAKENVEIDRSMLDVLKGKRGIAGKCMNARCIQRQPDAFPHPVLAVSVIKSRVFILDSLEHATRYILSKNASEEIHRHDAEGIGSPGKLTLYAPRGVARKGNDHTRGANRPRGANDGTRSRDLPKGEKARLVVAVGATSQLN